MFGRFLARGLRPFGNSNSGPRGPLSQRRNASSSNAQLSKQSGMHPLLKAALTSGTMSMAGDMLAQTLTRRADAEAGKPPGGYSAERMARMFGFGLAFYGPYQHFWYSALDWRFAGRSVPNFLSKVFLNQTVLAPVVLTAVFAWNLALAGDLAGVPAKLKRDLVPTMINGWKFWVPASSVNFYLIPLQYQVLYMSACGVLWTAYLSFASYDNSRAAVQPGGK